MHFLQQLTLENLQSEKAPRKYGSFCCIIFNTSELSNSSDTYIKIIINKAQLLLQKVSPLMVFYRIKILVSYYPRSPLFLVIQQALSQETQLLDLWVTILMNSPEFIQILFLHFLPSCLAFYSLAITLVRQTYGVHFFRKPLTGAISCPSRILARYRNSSEDKMY